MFKENKEMEDMGEKKDSVKEAAGEIHCWPLSQTEVLN